MFILKFYPLNNLNLIVDCFSGNGAFLSSVGLFSDFCGAYLIYRYGLSPKLREEDMEVEKEVVKVNVVHSIEVEKILNCPNHYDQPTVDRAEKIKKENQQRERKAKEYSQNSQLGIYLLLGGFILQAISNCLP